MGRMVATVALCALGAAASGVAGCGGDGDDRTVRVFAASSLSEAFVDMTAAFEADRPGVAVELNLAGSSALREQIAEGAPADVFAAADDASMAALVQDGVLGDDGAAPVTFATNRVTLAVQPGNPAGVSGLADLARPELLVGVCAVGVPCGDLARDVLDRGGVAASVDTEEPNVRALAQKIADGELDVGLVYVTDVDDRLAAVPIGPAGDVVARYPIVALPGSGPDAAAFVDFVLSDAGRRILADHGFGAP